MIKAILSHRSARLAEREAERRHDILMTAGKEAVRDIILRNCPTERGPDVVQLYAAADRVEAERDEAAKYLAIALVKNGEACRLEA